MRAFFYYLTVASARILCLFFCTIIFFSPALATESLTIQQTISALAFLKDRSTGSQGAGTAAQFIEHALNMAFSSPSPTNAQVIIDRQSFLVPIQQHQGSTITLLSPKPHPFSHKSIRNTPAVWPISPLLQNAVSTGSIASNGLTGRVIYVEKGRLRDFDGLDVSGNIVVMDIASGKNWTNAAMLGAGAVIFVGDRHQGGLEYKDKLELTPIDFPRFWMEKAYAEDIFGTLEDINTQNIQANLTSRTTWVNTIAENIWAFIPGSTPSLKNELLFLEAFYDSTAFVPGKSPGAEESVSVATLLHLAQELGKSPPKRPVLLMASAGHAQGAAGMREFSYLLTTPKEKILARKKYLALRRDTTKQTLHTLQKKDPLAYISSEQAREAGDAELLRVALYAIAKEKIDKLSTKLMRLRLQKRTDTIAQKITNLAEKRIQLRRLRWIASPLRAQQPIIKAERDLTASLLPEAIETQQAILHDVTLQLKAIEGSLRLKQQIGNRKIKAGITLHLSSHGDGIGPFGRGWLYELKKSVNRTRFFAPLGETLNSLNNPSSKAMHTLWQDTLRPSRHRPWQSYLPDTPQLNSEPLVLAGQPVITLATLHDLRPLWGTPYDTPETVDYAFVQKQANAITYLVRKLSQIHLPETGILRTGFSSLEGRVNLLRHGELFPDKPAAGSITLVYQGKSRFYTMVDSEGTFRLPGLTLRKQTVHKAIIEAFRFDPQTGRAIWAIDKLLTGKDNYRIKMRRKVMKTDLTMFACAQTTLFSLIEPRTQHYLYRPKLIDARTESDPLRFWYSRLDTRDSSLGTFFLEPDVPIKLTLSDTVTQKKILLLNSDAESPTGQGYRITDWPTLPMTEYRAAKDMWNLLNPRVHNLEQHGIINDRIQDLTQRGQAAMKQATEAMEKKQWSTAFSQGRTALSLASLVYGDVDTVQRDVLAGVLFYIALFIPFAYCMERLIFAFSSIHKRIAAFLGILFLTIATIYVAHPAFQLTYSPLVVILAFFIIGLSGLVSLIIFLRFEREMEELQRRSRHMKSSEISKGAAFAAAIVIGVSNLRRRPVRTGLTITTLVILTFTIMNFTAAQSIRREGWIPFTETASYRGLLLKQLQWRSLPPEILQTAEDMFGKKNYLAPRVWYETKDLTHAPVIPIVYKGKELLARAVIGLSHTEPQVSGLDTRLAWGKWFAAEDRDAIIIPENFAQKLGIPLQGSPQISLWGIPLTVRGVLQDNALNTLPDLDGEPITPIIYPNEASTQLSEVEAEAIARGEDILRYESRYEHIAGKNTIIVPAHSLLTAGGMVKSLAISPIPKETTGITPSLKNLGDRFGTMLFSGDAKGVKLYYASNATTYVGVSSILVPLAIAILIVLNTMIGSVHERRNEIGVYTSIGLAPLHVSFLFVAEALAFAIISVVLGYLVAQGTAAVFAGTPLWAGMTANYSSTAGVAAMLLVIGVVLISVIYPSRVAASIAIPDVNRSWKLPEAQGDTMKLTLPFLIKTSEQSCAGGYLMDYYSAHTDISHGAFSTENIACSFIAPETLPEHGVTFSLPKELEKEDSCFSMELQAWLAPFDFGVRQYVKLLFCPSETYTGFKQIQIILTREAGEHRVWQNLNKRFLNALRKQLLVWRSLDTTAREHYEQELKQTVRQQLPLPHKTGDAHA